MEREAPAIMILRVRILCACVILLGFSVLCGWAFNISKLQSVLPGLASMKVNAAISFILCGASLALLTRKENSGWTLSASGLAAGITVSIALLTLAEYGFDWNAGIDQLFFNEPQGMSFTASPGRMAVIAALMYLLQGVSLLLMVLRRNHVMIQVLALISGLIALLPIGGYLFGNLLFPKIGHSR
jgi:hypothetical protein